jgi:hypothetical protein
VPEASVASEAWLVGSARCVVRIGGRLIAARTRSRHAPGGMVFYTMIDEVSLRREKAAKRQPLNHLLIGFLQLTGTTRLYVTPRAMRLKHPLDGLMVSVDSSRLAAAASARFAFDTARAQQMIGPRVPSASEPSFLLNLVTVGVCRVLMVQLCTTVISNLPEGSDWPSHRRKVYHQHIHACRRVREIWHGQSQIVPGTWCLVPRALAFNNRQSPTRIPSVPSEPSIPCC